MLAAGSNKEFLAITNTKLKYYTIFKNALKNYYYIGLSLGKNKLNFIITKVNKHYLFKFPKAFSLKLQFIRNLL